MRFLPFQSGEPAKDSHHTRYHALSDKAARELDGRVRVKGSGESKTATAPDDGISYAPPQGTSFGGIRVKYGDFERIYHRRLNFTAMEDTPFSTFLNTHLGPQKRILIAVRGWTRVNPEFFKDPRMVGLDPKQKQDIADQIYIHQVKEYLEAVLRSLEAQGYNREQIENNIGFIYGVTPQGVDKAIEDFCREHQLKCVGITCKKWLPYIGEDEPNLPDIYVADTAADMTALINQHADKILLLGGRGHSATYSSNGEPLQAGQDGNNIPVVQKIFPIDITRANQIPIPGLSYNPKADQNEVENASAVLLGESSFFLHNQNYSLNGYYEAQSDPHALYQYFVDALANSLQRDFKIIDSLNEFRGHEDED